MNWSKGSSSSESAPTCSLTLRSRSGDAVVLRRFAITRRVAATAPSSASGSGSAIRLSGSWDAASGPRVEADLDAGRDYLARSLESGGPHPSVYYALADVVRRLGDQEQAARYLEQFKATEAQGSNWPDPWLASLGTSDADLMTAAVRALERGDIEQAIELNPDHAEWHFNLGLTQEAAGRDGDALRTYARAIELMPSEVEPLLAKNDKLRAGHKRACQGNALTLPAGKFRTQLAGNRVEAFGKLFDEVLAARMGQSPHNILIA